MQIVLKKKIRKNAFKEISDMTNMRKPSELKESNQEDWKDQSKFLLGRYWSRCSKLYFAIDNVINRKS